MGAQCGNMTVLSLMFSTLPVMNVCSYVGGRMENGMGSENSGSAMILGPGKIFCLWIIREYNI